MLPDTPKKPAKSKKTIFRSVSEWLHLWLGLISGIVVFVVCLTGGIWVWRYEVWYFTEKYQRVEARQKPYLPPSQLIARSKDYLRHKGDTEARFDGITYGAPGKSVSCVFELGEEKHAMIYLDPYTGKVLKDKRKAAPSEAFFIFVRAGHRFFWLPQKIGSPFVGSACILFLIILITGLIWWYPKKWTKKTRDKSFKIKWSARWKRLNIDLHNVLGFYSLIFVILLTATGIVFTFDWFENGVYKALTFKSKPEFSKESPVSDTTIIHARFDKPVDVIWGRMLKRYNYRFGRLTIGAPERTKEPYRAFVQFGDGTLIYNSDTYYYDGKTLEQLSWKGEKAIPYQELSAGEKIFRMNFDIHTGQILGLPTKIIAFLACIIGASLPVTGTIIWYNRKWGKKRKNSLL